MIAAATGVPVEKGPKDLREIPQHFGRAELAPLGDALGFRLRPEGEG